ncbi:hypothetical protein FLAG1_07469 [Fusarium langsethiae]|uniref:Uncharacterized protein n=1 Tax=Fusarium langsethiae TaxID=179993 RepID=A0A0M9ETV5_FUSLA|nr:hypothetical protein FLAG1_07469 [Fusarium langsethiae]GKU04810.1 unnamed protein product [Fusarium langsethiae]GKU20579.1 unnamed protein product [Fusarium langsethiae]
MDDRFADPLTPTMEQGSIFQNPTTATTTGTTNRPGPSSPGSLASIMSWPGWPVDQNGEDAKYLTLMSKIENLEAGNSLILDDIARLSHQVAKITEIINMPHGARPSVIESPKASFSKSLHTPKVPGTKVEIPEAEDSPPKIIIPRMTKVARVEIQFGSPDHEAKEHDSKSSHVSSANAASTLPRSTPTKPAPGFQSAANSYATYPEESAEYNFESLNDIALSSEQYHQVEERVPSEESESVEQDEVDRASRTVVQQLANNDTLFAFFIRYLTNPKPNLARQIATVRDDTAHILARSFQSAVVQPGPSAIIGRSEFSYIRATVGDMSESTRVDLYIALSHRYHKKYGRRN